MDALALLCTLHADGPQTLKRLRSSGCDSLQVLESFDPAALARMLDVAPAVARRLAREARLLAQRVDLDVGMEREEAPRFEAPAAVAAGPVHATFGGASPVVPSPVVHAGAAHGDQLERRDREILDKVMDRWREADARTPGTPEPDPAATDRAAANEAELGDPVLQADDLDGLSANDVDGLARAGVETLPELVDCDSLATANSAGMPFAAVKRFQLLARRQLGVTGTAASPHRATVAETGAAEPPAEAPVDPSRARAVVSEAAFSPAEDEVPLAETQVEHEAGTVLDWNFEIPLPPTRAPAGYDDPSGPFA